jgi:hypothetical protein
MRWRELTRGNYAATARRRVSINPWSAITILRAAIVAPYISRTYRIVYAARPLTTRDIWIPSPVLARHVCGLGTCANPSRSRRRCQTHCRRSPCKGLSVPRRSACAIGEYNPCGSLRCALLFSIRWPESPPGRHMILYETTARKIVRAIAPRQNRLPARHSARDGRRSKRKAEPDRRAHSTESRLYESGAMDNRRKRSRIVASL